MSKRSYLLDTCVLLHDPDALYKFAEHNVIISEAIIQELDRKKSEPGVLGSSSREVTRHLLELSQKGDLRTGVSLGEDKGTVLVKEIIEEDKELPVDKQLINLTALLQRRAEPDKEFVLVTKDRNLELLARIEGVQAENYKHGRVKLYSGNRSIEVPTKTVDTFFKNRELLLTELKTEELRQNEFVILIDECLPKHTALGIVKGDKLHVLRKDICASNIRPLNTEQRFALYMLLDSSITAITLTGASGSGKTLLTLAAALQQQGKGYDQVIITRKEMPVGDSQGFLPGGVEEKTQPWMAGFNGCLGKLAKTSNYHPGKDIYVTEPHELFLNCAGGPPPVKAIALAYVRGVTWDNCFIIVDEAQNMHPKEVQTIATRVGQDSKIVFLGDMEQIDKEAARYMDSESNGLAVFTNRMLGWNRFAHLHMTESERSETAAEVVKRYA